MCMTSKQQFANEETVVMLWDLFLDLLVSSTASNFLQALKKFVRTGSWLKEQQQANRTSRLYCKCFLLGLPLVSGAG